MTHNLVIYIRAIFEQSLMTNLEKSQSNLKVSQEIFDTYSKIKLFEYRKQIRNLQKQNLFKITNQFIINEKDETFPECYPFVQPTPSTIKKIQNLNDNDIVIPLDDDDWLSPKIKETDFNQNGLTIWNSVKFHDSYNIQFFDRNNELPLEPLQKLDDRLHCKNLLSNCYAIPAKLLKQFIQEDKKEDLQLILQRHHLVRETIRKDEYKIWNITERVLPNYLSVYVKHAANATGLQKLDSKKDYNYNLHLFQGLISVYKNYDYSRLRNVDPEIRWALPLLFKLQEINQLI